MGGFLRISLSYVGLCGRYKTLPTSNNITYGIERVKETVIMMVYYGTDPNIKAKLLSAASGRHSDFVGTYVLQLDE